MAFKRNPKKQGDRVVVRTADRLVATLRNSTDRKDFEQRLLVKCDEVGLPYPSYVPYGSGEMVIISCKSRDQAIFLIDFAEEVLDEMTD